MNEEIEKAIGGIKANAAQWDILNIGGGNLPEKTDLARRLCLQLTTLKLLVGIHNFDELPYFSLYLRDVTRFLERQAREEERS